MATYTPLPYWLSLPIGDVYEWSSTVIQIQHDDAAKPKPPPVTE